MPKNKIITIFVVTAKIMLVLSKEDTKINPDKFPDIFYMDDYYECSSQNSENSYCTANINLIPKDPYSKIWKQIEDWSISPLHYNHTVIHRTWCIPGKHKDYLEKKYFVETRANQELKMFNLSAEMFSIDCRTKDFGTNIKLILFGSAIYLGLIALCTLYDCLFNTQTRQSTVGEWLTIFSLTSNWKKLTSSKNPDFQRLKCIQGIRTYQTLIVIGCHILLASVQLHIRNTSYVERQYENALYRTGFIFFMYVIQTYFVVSTWLLTNQILGLYKKNGLFSIRDAVVLLLHRITRFWAPLLVMIFIAMPLFTTFYNGPGNFEMANILSKTCSKNWLATFFLITNFYEVYEVCNLGMWSLSVDTQCYIVCILFLYVALKYNVNIKKYLAIMFIFTYIINVVVFYRHEFSVVTWIHLKLSKRIDFYQNQVTGTGYFGFWVNAGSSLVGILFGYFYFHSKENTKKEPFEHLYLPMFAFLPIVSVLIGTLNPGRLASALIGPLLKPLFGFGIAIGIYGMSRDVVKGWTKSVCENKYAVLLGSFTFSIYIYHFQIIFTMEAKNSSLIELDEKHLAVALIINLAKSYAVGIFGALVVEQPATNIKNMILPQIRKKEETSIKQCHNYKEHKEK